MLRGGQQGNLRSGTENVPGIAGLAKAVELVYKNLDQDTEKLYHIGVNRFDQRSCLRYGLQGANLVIGMHNGNQYGFSRDRPLQILCPDASFCIHRQVSHAKSLFLQMLWRYI